jgi:hypothetical protein
MSLILMFLILLVLLLEAASYIVRRGCGSNCGQGIAMGYLGA